MEVSSSSSSTSNASSWVSNLSVLPPRLRLEFQKTITNDITVQSSLPAPPPFHSRAYTSLKNKVPMNGLGAIKPTVFGNLKNAPGGKIKAIQRQFPSTADILADMILQAAHAVRAKPLRPFDNTTKDSVVSSLNHDTEGKPSSGLSSSLSNLAENLPSTSSTVPAVSDEEYHALVKELRNYGLDTAYRIPVCRNLQRRLPIPSSTTTTSTTNPSPTGDNGWVYEGTNKSRYPHALEISNGTLTQKVQVALDDQIQERKQSQQSQQPITSSNNNVSVPNPPIIDKETKTNAPVVSAIDDADLALLDEALDELD